ncbi:MAG: glycine--tRNA ligase subunit beta [Burkholderiaceae bacterium]
MSDVRSLLVELQAEELPPKALNRLGEAFAAALAVNLKAQGFVGDAAVVKAYATPRRLAVHMTDVRTQAADRTVTHKLMPAAVGLDSAGQPTPALVKKLAALGADASAASAVERRPDGKVDSLFWTTLVPGAPLATGLQAALAAALAALPIPKLMSYQLPDGWRSVQFARPVHGLLALHGTDVVPVSALGLDAGRQTRGHRFEGPTEPLEIAQADDYATQLERRGAVIPGFAERRAEVLRQLHQAAARQGLRPIDDPALLDEVTALVEQPNVLACRFETAFLAVPSECLILTMKANQKYFPLLDEAGRLTEHFLVVSNIRPEDPRQIVEGNQRVVRPRLADARFFYDQDRKRTLESRLPILENVVYHGKLGSQRDRIERVRAIARAIGEQLGGSALAADADRAALLAKADLVTDMVGEFPELQGVMGGYYARHDGESDSVSFAIEDHYKPRFAGDALPRQEVGLVVALADKAETLLGMFQIGEMPTGDRDPFALRRQALGILRICIERQLPFSIGALVSLAGEAWDVAQAAIDAQKRRMQFSTGVEVDQGGPLHQEILDEEQKTRAAQRNLLIAFVQDRLNALMRDQGHSAQEVDAVLSLRSIQLSEIPRRLAAVHAFAGMPESAPLASANKRIANILRKSDAVATAAVDTARLIEPAEVALYDALMKVKPMAEAFFQRADYTSSLCALAVLKTPVDAFFDGVMVNADEPELRANRLALLVALHTAMNRVADLSKLAA